MTKATTAKVSSSLVKQIILKEGLFCHRGTYQNFILKYAFRVSNTTEIENLIKNDCRIIKHLRSVCIDGSNKVELISYNDKFTLHNIKTIFIDIIENRTYSEKISNAYYKIITIL